MVGLHDPIEIAWTRSVALETLGEATWNTAFDLLLTAKRIAMADDDIAGDVRERTPARFGATDRAILLANLASALQRQGDPELARQVFHEALKVAALVGQAAVVRVCRISIGLLLEAPDVVALARRIHEELLNGGHTGTQLGREAAMAVFDQRGQHVTYQYNAAGDINLDAVVNRAQFSEQLQKLQREVEAARQAKALPEEAAADVENQLKRAAIEASKPTPQKASVVGYLTAAKELFEAATATGGLVTAVTKAIEVASKLF